MSSTASHRFTSSSASFGLSYGTYRRGDFNHLFHTFMLSTHHMAGTFDRDKSQLPRIPRQPHNPSIDLPFPRFSHLESTLASPFEVLEQPEVLVGEACWGVHPGAVETTAHLCVSITKRMT